MQVELIREVVKRVPSMPSEDTETDTKDQLTEEQQELLKIGISM